MRFYTINTKNINLDNVCCLNFTDTTIEFCFSEVVGDKLTFTRVSDLSAASFDAIKLGLQDIIKYN